MTGIGLVPAAAFALLIVLAMSSRLRARRASGRLWILLRVLFPSWRFFDQLGQVPQLWFRVQSEGTKDPAEEPVWQEAFAPERRPLGTLFLNARGNLRMAANSLVEQLISDLSDLPDGGETEIGDSVSYELVTRLVRFRIRELACAQPGDCFQFKIVSNVPGSREESAEDILISPRTEV